MKSIKYLFLLICLISFSWGAQAIKISSDSQLLSGTHTTAVIGDYLIKNDSVSFIISDIPNTQYPGKSGGLCIDATLEGGSDDFDLLYLYLNNDYPRQAIYSTIQIISSGTPYDSANIRVSGVDSDNSAITIITDYVLYNNTPMLKVKTKFHNQSASTIYSYGMGDAFSWGSNPFVPGGNLTSDWIASNTPNTKYGYIANENFEATHGSYWSDVTLEETNLLAGNSANITRYFTIAEDLAGIYDTYLDMKDISTGQVTVSVSQEDQAVNDALIWFIKDMESEPTLKVYTDNLGLANSRLETGNWICRVIANGQNDEQSITISENSHQDIIFTFGAIGHDTLTIIQSPLINIPNMSLPGDTINVKINLAESESVQSLSLLFNGNEYPLDFIESTISSPFGLRTLEAYLPSTMFYGLYDLKIMCTGTDSMDISEHAIYVIPKYKNDFSFIHVTDTHMPSHHFWGEEGLEIDSTELLDFRAVIDDINIINPDFVLHTGDFINDGEIEELGIPSISRAKKLLHELEVPLFLVSGNHDLGGWDSTPASDGTARRTWWKYFGWNYLNNTNPSATTTQNYSFDYGNTHFIGLEAYNNYDRWREEIYGSDSFTASQLQWLNNELTAHSNADLIIAFYHKDFQNQLDLSSLGIDAAFWGHVHSNNEDYTLPYDISTGSTCDGNRWYRLVTVSNNTITSMKTFQAGNNGQLITKTVSSDQLSVTFTNNSNATFHDCLVKFPLETGKQVDSILHATLMQIDTLSTPKMVYAYFDLPANSSVITTMTIKDAPITAINSVPENNFLMSVYPNPFNPQLSVNYQLSIVSMIDINIYNIQGKIVDTLFIGEQYPGTYELNWDASNQPSGLYFVKASIINTSGKFQTVEKCLLMK